MSSFYKTTKVRDTDVITYGGKQVSSKWNFRLDAIYCIAVLGYALIGSKAAVNYGSLRNDEAPYEVYYDKLKFVTVELPLFDESKQEYSLDRHLNKWLFFLKYLPLFEYVQDIFKGDPVFEKAFLIAEWVNLSPTERQLYQMSLKHSLDAVAVISYSHDEGMRKGIKKGMEIGPTRVLDFLCD